MVKNKMSEEEIKVQDLSQEQIRKLLEEAEVRSEEARYLLKVERYVREDLYDRLSVVFGNAEIVSVSIDKQQQVVTDIVIPKSSHVVIAKKTISNYQDYDGTIEIYVFIGTKGWVNLS
ncbi:MAG: hypothetical protein OWS74_01710 [Firmicutes bacterium]|nr:hypothetical protein [Bacillota bacterium]